MIQLRFVRERGFISSLIAWFSAGHVSHVDVVLAGGKLLGARADRVGGVPPGVQIRPHGYIDPVLIVEMDLLVSPEQEAVFYRFLQAQVGKPYDRIAILGFIVGRNWRDDGAWFCSELVAAALENAGIVPRLYTPANKLTPAALATVVSAITVA